MPPPNTPPFSVLVHPYPSPVQGSCAYEMGNTSSRNAFVFIGGLGDGPHSTPFIWTIAKSLEKATDLGYSVFECRLRSSFSGFGHSSLANDVHDISALVNYLRSIGREKVVLMGHSTGCQDCVEYTKSSAYNDPVDAFILQAPVSDREALKEVFPEYKDSLALASEMVANGKGREMMPSDKTPSALGAPMNAYRLWSLCAKGGDDDYFSSDLDDETVSQIWKRFKQPVLVLHSEEDEFVPPDVDQAGLNARYQDQNPLVSPLSGLIPGTGHTVLQEEARSWLSNRVVEFLKTLNK